MNRVALVARGSRLSVLDLNIWHWRSAVACSVVSNRLDLAWHDNCSLSALHFSGRFDIAVRAEHVLWIPSCLYLGEALEPIA